MCQQSFFSHSNISTWLIFYCPSSHLPIQNPSGIKKNDSGRKKNDRSYEDTNICAERRMKIGKWKEIIISINYGSLARQHHHDCLEGEFSSYFAILPFSALVVSLATHHYSFFFTKHGNLSLLLLLFRAMMPCFFVRDARNLIKKRREAEINKGPVLGLHIKAFLLSLLLGSRFWN